MIRTYKHNGIDDVISQFWKNGYLTISRKNGKYLPAPQKVGDYEIDAVGKYKKKIAIGITINEDDIKDPGFPAKLAYLSSRHTKYTNSEVKLFAGVPRYIYDEVKKVINSLSEKSKKNIKLVQLAEEKEERLL